MNGRVPIFSSLLQAFIPNYCRLCSQACSDVLCKPCTQQLPRLNAACEICSVPLPQPGICPECQQHVPSFDRIIAPFEYRNELSWLLKRFKHHNDHAIGLYLIDQWIKHLDQAHKLDWVDRVIPVPMHWHRAWERGFNQAEVFSRRAAKAMGLEHALVLKKRKPTPAQQWLNRNKRLKNLQNGFVIDGNVEGKHLVVVDDVVTTCATAESVARVLKQAGAASVSIWAIARTPKPNTFPLSRP